tara:strand:+ start:307 stop:663 length:357 start_codon:yes stop_codon:yes gene_type:complete
MKKIILIISLFVVSCASIPRAMPVDVRTIAERPPIYHPPLPVELQLLAVKFEVLTPSIMKEYLELIEAKNEPERAYYALTTQQYENLSNNMAELKRYLNNILLIVQYYREYDEEKDDS